MDGTSSEGEKVCVEKKVPQAQEDLVDEKVSEGGEKKTDGSGEGQEVEKDKKVDRDEDHAEKDEGKRRRKKKREVLLEDESSGMVVDPLVRADLEHEKLMQEKQGVMDPGAMEELEKVRRKRKSRKIRDSELMSKHKSDLPRGKESKPKHTKESKGKGRDGEDRKEKEKDNDNEDDGDKEKEKSKEKHGEERKDKKRRENGEAETASEREKELAKGRRGTAGEATLKPRDKKVLLSLSLLSSSCS